MKWLDFKIGTRIPLSAYLKQSLMATTFLFVFFLGWHQVIPLANQVLFSAVASSTLLTFVSTSIYTSLSNKIVGGQVIGVLVGTGLWFGAHHAMAATPHWQNEVFMLALALSAGLSLLVMALLNFEHPPGAGTAMAFTFNPAQPVLADALFVLICALLLAFAHAWLKKRQLIKDLE